MLKQQIKKSRNIKDVSLNTYISALKKIKKKVDGDTELDDTEFLEDFEDIIQIIDSEKKLTSKKNKLTAILVALNSDNPRDQKLINKYSAKLKELGEQYLAFLKTQKKTETQSKNWLTYDELINTINKVMRDVKEMRIPLKDELNNREFDTLQQLLILRTYLAFPLRNDFAEMKVLSKLEFDNLSEDKRERDNYLVLGADKDVFIINQFKNQKSLGSKSLTVPPKLRKVISMWMKHNKSGWYLVKTNRTTPMNPNGITKFLNKIFEKRVNKKISTSMIRHIIISHLLKGTPTIAQEEEKKKDIENTFMHSKEMNQLYRKVDREDGSDLPKEKEKEE